MSSERRATLRELAARFSKSTGRNALFYTATTMLSRAAILLLAPIYTRRLSPDEYGDLALAQTLISTIPTFVSLGMLSALSRFFFEGSSQVEGIARAGAVARWIAVLALGSAVFAQVLVLLLPLSVSGLFSAHALSCVIWGATGTLMLGVPLVIFRSAQRAGVASALQLTDFGFTLVSSIVLVAFLDRGMMGALEATGLAGALSTMVNLIFLARTMPGDLDPKVLRRALEFSVPFIPHFVANQLLVISDRWLLKAFGLSTELGVYSLAAQLVAPLTILVVSWNEAASPKVGEAFREGGVSALRDGESKIVRSYLMVVTIAGIALVLVSPIVMFAIGKAFGAALWYLPGLVLAVIVETAYYPYSNFLFFTNNTAVIPKVTIASAVVTILANVLLIPILGVAGAIIGRTLGGGLRSLLSASAVRKILSTSP